MQSASTILLIRPRDFGYNPETAANNAFQNVPADSGAAVSARAITEFDHFAAMLRQKGVHVLVFEDTAEPAKPDAVFPNNWVSFHPNGLVVLYPMFAPLRRAERRLDIIRELEKKFLITHILDLSHYEEEGKFLEGTGSIVFDHMARLAYACVSPRTDQLILRELCEKIGYREIAFHAYDEGGMQIYHTNVMMCVGTGFAVVCLECIHNPREKELVQSALEVSGHKLVTISLSQVTQFAGNMLAVHTSGKQLLVMSETAHASLTAGQKSDLTQFCELVPVSVETIETVGGGSARCMMAEVFLEPRDEGPKTVH